MIVARDLSVRRGAARVLDRVDVDVRGGGRWLSLVGPNGAGKSTLLLALAGIVPSDGTLTVDGQPIATIGRAALARRIALVSQVPFMPEGLRVGEYLLLGRTPYLGRLGVERPHDHAVVREVAERLDLTWALDRAVASLSGGERQRVAIGRALAQQPRFMLLDEPTTGLDLAQQHRVLDVVTDLRRATGVTVVAATHDLTVAAELSDEIVLIRGGRIVAAGPTGAVMTEATLAHAYGIGVRVHDVAGGIAVLPARDDPITTEALP